MAILTREDSTNISLLLARPETEVRRRDPLPPRGSPLRRNDLKTLPLHLSPPPSTWSGPARGIGGISGFGREEMSPPGPQYGGL